MPISSLLLRRMNDFAKNNFNLILFAATIAGFILPAPGKLSGPLILLVLFIIIFSSSFKVDFSPSFFKSQTQKVVLFYIFRFLILPVLLFLAIKPFSAFYATNIFLLAVLPGGVSAPAFTNVFKGNITLALALLIISSFFAPFILPFLSSWVIGEALQVDKMYLFFTLFVTVILPYLFHLPLRRNQTISSWIQKQDSFISIVGISLIFALAIAEYRPVLLTEPGQILPSFIVGVCSFVLLYAVGWAVFFKAPKADRIALLFNSGANNVALGVVISFLYFPSETGVFFVVCEIIWVAILIPVRRWVSRM